MPEEIRGSLRARSIDGTRVWVDWQLDDEWAAGLWRTIAANDHDDFLHPELPGGGSAVVKIYRRRPKHGLLRRLRAGRAEREGNGYVAFNRRSVPTVKLLMFGEARRAGLHEWGAVVTRREDVPTVAEAFAADGDVERLRATAQLLAGIHAAGLTHGDALTRNFLAASPRPIAFDLASWGWRKRSARTEDMVRFLGSITASAGRDVAADVLAHYRGWAADLPDADDELLDAAERYAATKAARR